MKIEKKIGKIRKLLEKEAGVKGISYWVNNDGIVEVTIKCILEKRYD